MLILAEKPSVAEDFRNALGNRNDVTITNCIGHLFQLEEPNHYSSQLPIIPSRWDYITNPSVEKQAAYVKSLLIKHKNDDILIATDADREGEIIARECLMMAGINDYSRIKRFWVSQALTNEVILEGMQKAKPLHDYDNLAKQGFARSHADWLVGMNCSRYISNCAKSKFPVGRVQTALLNAIYTRCKEIENFKSEKYFEFHGNFSANVTGILYKVGQDETSNFKDNSLKSELQKLVGEKFNTVSKDVEDKTQNPPKLYNLTAAQKDAFRLFEYSADKTLKIIQSLYEDLKVISYPRTPSRVMGSQNIDLCKKIYIKICDSEKRYSFFLQEAIDNFNIENKRCFNDAELEAHHALIPLDILPEDATEEQRNIYTMITERFLISFLPPYEYKLMTMILEKNGYFFKITGKKTTISGWKNEKISNSFIMKEKKDQENEDYQNLENLDMNNQILTELHVKEKWTKPPKYFNEASILAFMENPVENDKKEKLVGIGTPATRHSFIPKLIKFGYIEIKGKNYIYTEKGKLFLDAIQKSPLTKMTDIHTTTLWEEKLQDDPIIFEKDIEKFIRASVSNEMTIDTSSIKSTASNIVCPLCGKTIREGKSNWYCSGYKDGCKFPSIWKTTRGTTFTQTDIKNLIAGKKTSKKKCNKKDGGSYECSFKLNDKFEISACFVDKK